MNQNVEFQSSDSRKNQNQVCKQCKSINISQIAHVCPVPIYQDNQINGDKKLQVYAQILKDLDNGSFTSQTALELQEKDKFKNLQNLQELKKELERKKRQLTLEIQEVDNEEEEEK